jgi:hypothetical protein
MEGKCRAKVDETVPSFLKRHPMYKAGDMFKV